MSDVLPEPEDFGAPLASEAHTSYAGQLGAEWANTLDPKDSLSGGYIFRRMREAAAGGADLTGGTDIDGTMTPDQLEQREQLRQAQVDAIPDTSIDDAKARVKQEGLEKDIRLPDQPSIKSPVLDLMIQEAHDRRDREAAIARGPDSFLSNALGSVTSMGVGMIDPVNAAAFSIPVLGEARVAGLVARAGDSMLARAGVKAGVGAVQGAAGTAILQPADWWLHTRDGQDYTFAQALQSVVMGAGIGCLAHSTIGAAGDIRSRLRGAPLEGSPHDLLQRGLMTGTHVHADQLDQDGVPIGDLPGMEGHEVPGIAPAAREVAAVVADLPPAAREDAVHAAMADAINGTEPRAAEMLNIAADHEPRIAESFDAWHGSPHEVDRFDSSRIGTGEGAQSYGHGLYFAEKEGTARYYRDALSPQVSPLARGFIERHDGDLTAALKDFDDHYGKALGDDSPFVREARAEIAAGLKPGGNLYRVLIKANQDHFIDWDKPLSEQSPHVRAAIEKLVQDHSVFRGGAVTGRELYEHLAGEMATRKKLPPDENGFYKFDEGHGAASNALAGAGVHGIKYLDSGSRDAGEGTRNFVIFDDKHIEITHKNGEPVSIEQLRASPEARSEAAAQPKIPDLVTAPKPRGRAAAHPDTLSLGEHLASQGGLRPDPELKAIYGGDRGPFIPGFGPLVRKSGMSLDEALSSAKQHGYMFDPHDAENGTAGQTGPSVAGRTSHGLTPNDLLDHLDAENRGRKLYKPGHEAATKFDPEQEKHVIMGALEHELEASGAKVSDIDPKLLNRAVEIVHREGETDVMAAYERAIMEDAESYDAIANARQSDPATADIPGFDHAPDAGAASGDGRADPEGGGPQGRTDQGAGAGDGQEPPGHGAGDRGAQLAAAAADPRWRQLADVKPDYDQPDVLEESRAADLVEDPASAGTPERALSALEQEAKRAEEIWKQIEPTLTEKERALVNDVLGQLKLDKEARDKIISDGVACLVGAIG